MRMRTSDCLGFCDTAMVLHSVLDYYNMWLVIDPACKVDYGIKLKLPVIDTKEFS